MNSSNDSTIGTNTARPTHSIHSYGSSDSDYKPTMQDRMRAQAEENQKLAAQQLHQQQLLAPAPNHMPTKC